jgi:catecholate siderophore receptor
VNLRVALVPRNTVSLWNRYQVASSLGFGLGVIYQDAMFAAIDDAVTLPSFVRVDAAAYYTANRWVRLQANVENVFDRTYYPTANSNNNITPGSPRAVRVAVATAF